MIINDQEGKILLALRAGPMHAFEIHERFPNSSSNYLSSLSKKNLIEEGVIGYKITALSREHCPTRRQPRVIEPVLQKQEQKPKAAPATIKVVPSFTTTKPVNKTEQTMLTPTAQALNGISRTLQILQYIEQNPNTTSRHISKALGFYFSESFIKGYIASGMVVVGHEDKNKTYTLKQGFNAERVHASRNIVREKKQFGFTTQKQLEDLVFGEKTPQLILDDEAIPTFGHVQTAAAPALTEKAVQATQKVRFAFTSEHTLIIQGVSYQDIELTPAQTEALFEFVESASLMMPTTGSFSIGGATL